MIEIPIGCQILNHQTVLEVVAENPICHPLEDFRDTNVNPGKIYCVWQDIDWPFFIQQFPFLGDSVYKYYCWTWMGNQTQKLKKNFDGSIELTWTTRFVHMFGQKQAKPRHKSGKTELWIQVYLPKANYKPTRPWQIIEFERLKVQRFWVWVFVEKNKRAGPDSLLYISWKTENVYTYLHKKI